MNKNIQFSFHRHYDSNLTKNLIKIRKNHKSYDYYNKRLLKIFIQKLNDSRDFRENTNFMQRYKKKITEKAYFILDQIRLSRKYLRLSWFP